jgi:transcriptional regulator with XRE-family HTH domain
VTINIGAKIKTLRKGKRMTQEQLADALKITRASVSNYELGRRTPHLSELKRIAEYFGVGLDYFGIVPTDEVFDLLSRAKEVFNSPAVPKEKKDDIYKEIMKIYLSL